MGDVKRRLTEAATRIRHGDLHDLTEVSPNLTAAALRAKLLAVVRDELNGDGQDLEARLIPPSPPETV